MCDETFLLFNMAPQVGRGFNRDKWEHLERYARKLTKLYRNVYVCTGPQVVGQNNGKASRLQLGYASYIPRLQLGYPHIHLVCS